MPFDQSYFPSHQKQNYKGWIPRRHGFLAKEIVCIILKGPGPLLRYFKRGSRGARAAAFSSGLPDGKILRYGVLEHVEIIGQEQNRINCEGSYSHTIPRPRKR